jgi:carbonic anhydrase
MNSLDPAADADAALQALLDGNARFADGCATRPHSDATRRLALLDVQRPFAAVLACSDSRIVPELIFDCGLGDLFVIRVAGNVAGRVATGSIEYAAAHLRVPLIVVLGHSGCSAVTATLSAPADDRIEDAVPAIAGLIRPAVDICSAEADVESVTKANASLTAERLARESEVLGKLVESGGTRIVAAYYNMTTGRVSVL